MHSVFSSVVRIRASNPGKIKDIKFQDFIRDELAIVSGIADHLLNENVQFEDTGNSSETYISNHRYQLEDWDIKPGDLNARFERYNNMVMELN